MLRYLIALILLTNILTAQYTPDDIELVKTIFTQTYDKPLITQYLKSDDEKRVAAGLLSISQSSDTTFIPQILQLNFETYGMYIAFALGQLGESAVSTDYLLKKLKTDTRLTRNIYEAIGKTGTEQTLNQLLTEYTPGANFQGISRAIANFGLRSIIDSNKVFPVLKSEFLNKKNNVADRIDALYAASRLKTPRSLLNDLSELLKENIPGEPGIYFLQYALSGIRKTGSIRENDVKLWDLLIHQDWRIRTEAAKVCCFASFENGEQADRYFALLKDVNPNVSRQAAISIRNIKLSDNNRKIIHERLSSSLNNMASLTENTAGELFITFTTLFPEELHQTIRQFQSNINRNFIYNALEQNTAAPEDNLQYLLMNKPSDNLQTLNYFSALLPLSESVNGKLDNLLIDNLNSAFAPAVSIIAEGIDSSFILRNKSELHTLILKKVNTHLNDADFSEALISLASLANRIDSVFYKEVLNLLINSSLYSVQKFSSVQLKLPAPLKNLSNFDNAWVNAFKYKTAKVITSKGEFTIEFNPQIAPVSVGNFCYLALTNYFSANIFHRVVPNFVIQSGDRQGTGWGGPGYEIISEFNPLPYETGYVGMASSGKDTEGSQWFVMHSYFPHLNGRYTNFGKVIEGMDVVNAIDQGDRVIKVIPEP